MVEFGRLSITSSTHALPASSSSTGLALSAWNRIWTDVDETLTAWVAGHWQQPSKNRQSPSSRTAACGTINKSIPL